MPAHAAIEQDTGILEPAWAKFTRAFYRHCDGGADHGPIIQWRAVPNNVGGRGRAKALWSRKEPQIARWIKSQDGPGRGVYFGVCLRRRGATEGTKENCVQAPAAYVDIDCLSDGIDRDEALQTLKGCQYPPSYIVDSGRGYHAYWLFQEPMNIDVQSDECEQKKFEAINEGLARIFAADTTAAECARVLRVPGTHNTKQGKNLDVVVVHTSDAEYDPSDIQEWPGYQSPLLVATIVKKPTNRGTTKADASDPWSKYASEWATSGERVDIDAELDAMVPGDIHGHLLKATARLLLDGRAVDEAVEYVIAYLKAKDADWCAAVRRHYGHDWHQRRDVRDLAGMCKSFVKERMGADNHTARVERRADEAEEEEATEQEQPKATGTDGPEPVIVLDERRKKLWKQDLITNPKGDPIANAHNMRLYLLHDSPMTDRLRFNLMNQAVEFKDLKTQQWRRWVDADRAGAKIHLEVRGPSKNSLTDIDQAILKIADEHQVDPLADYLRSLEWDGVPRIDTFLIDYAGAKDGPEVREMCRRWMISGAARGISPGCQVDHVLVLEGDQGVRKTSLMRALAIDPEYFLEGLPVDEKAAIEALSGKWLVEISEMSAYKKQDIDRMKAMITTRRDTYRPPYGRFPEDHPRHCIFAGTINPGSRGYLKDETGNRRWWPIEVGRIDMDTLTPLIPQLWAEAVAAHLSGEPHFITDEDVNWRISKTQRSRMGYLDTVLYEKFLYYLDHQPNGEPCHDISQWIERPEPLQMFNVALFLVAIGRHADPRADTNIRTILKGEGWENLKSPRHVTIDGVSTKLRVFRRPDVERNAGESVPSVPKAENFGVDDFELK